MLVTVRRSDIISHKAKLVAHYVAPTSKPAALTPNTNIAYSGLHTFGPDSRPSLYVAQGQLSKHQQKELNHDTHIHRTADRAGPLNLVFKEMYTTKLNKKA